MNKSRTLPKATSSWYWFSKKAVERGGLEAASQRTLCRELFMYGRHGGPLWVYGGRCFYLSPGPKLDTFDES